MTKITKEQLETVILALQSDLSSGIEKLDLFTIIAQKIHRSDSISKEQRQSAKYALFGLITSQPESPDTEEFRKQFPNLVKLVEPEKQTENSDYEVLVQQTDINWDEAIKEAIEKAKTGGIFNPGRDRFTITLASMETFYCWDRGQYTDIRFKVGKL